MLPESNVDFKPLMSALAKAFHGATGYEFHECYSKDNAAPDFVSPPSAALFVATGYYRASIAFLTDAGFSWKKKSQNGVQSGIAEDIASVVQTMCGLMKQELSVSGRFQVQVEVDTDYVFYKELQELQSTIVRVRVPLRMNSGTVVMDCAFFVPENYDLME